MAQQLTPQEQEELRVVLSPAFQEPQTQALLTALDQVALARANSVTRQDFHSLRETVARLAEGQEALQQTVAQLVKGQQTLQEGQQTLEEGQRILQEAMAGLVRSHQELAAAQARTEQALQRVARQVGGLSETVGGDIEDIAYIVLHEVLRREFGWQVGNLERVWHHWNGGPVEVNIFGQAFDPSHPDLIIWIVGEAKHNLTIREVNRFAKVLALARAHLGKSVFPVCFCYRARPEVQQRLHELDIRLVFSYGRLLT